MTNLLNILLNKQLNSVETSGKSITVTTDKMEQYLGILFRILLLNYHKLECIGHRAHKFHPLDFSMSFYVEKLVVRSVLLGV